jgi:MtrB/PioB family decaheme-associated outer membrane protein
MGRALPGPGPAGFGARLALAGVLLAAAGGAQADVTVGGAVASGELELGGRAVTGDGWGESSRYLQYGVQDPGVVANGSFLIENATRPWYLRGWLSDASPHDQIYELEAGQWGLWRLGFDFSELPHVYTNQARSLYTESDGILNFPDADQAALQALSASAVAQSALLGTILAGSPGEEVDLRLRQGGGAFEVYPLEKLDLSAGYSIQDKKGTIPFGIAFGSPGGNFADFAAPLDQQTQEVTATARWTETAWNAEVGYLGSFFSDHFSRLIVDNPLAATDTTGASSQGRLATPPDNSAHTFRLAGAARLPVELPTRLSATFAYGRRFQDDDFLCHTINSAVSSAAGLASPDACVGAPSVLGLSDDSLDGDVATFLTNLVLTSRPTEKLNLTARYRLYDFDNDTPEIEFPAHVVDDQGGAVTETLRSVASEYWRQDASLEAAYRLSEPATLHLGYDWNQWNRSDDREVTRLDENGGNVALDLRLARWAQVRAGYELAVRRGNHYDPWAYFEETTEITDPVELSSLQFSELHKFDEADRVLNRVDLLGQILPRDDLSFALTGSLTDADYDHTDYGLESQEIYSLGGETAYRPVPWLGLSTWYTFENIRYEQQDRWRPRTFTAPLVVVDSPLNDWNSLEKDQIQNFGFDVDLVLVPDLLDATLGYGIQYATGKTNSTGVAGCVPAPPAAACLPPPGTAADGGNAENYPHLEDVLQTFYATLSYHVNESLTVKAGYRFQKFDVHDFRVDDLDPYEPTSTVNGSGTGFVPPTSRDVFLGERIGDYTANIFVLSMIYRF